jgi:hypothetical protein
MQLTLDRDHGPTAAPISPSLEMGAYEALWLREGAPGAQALHPQRLASSGPA